MDLAVDVTSAEPTFRQLAAKLRMAIASGEIPVNGRVPSANEIAAATVSDALPTGLAVATIRRALAVLKDEGLLRVSPGRGLYVIAVPPAGPS